MGIGSLCEDWTRKWAKATALVFVSAGIHLDLDVIAELQSVQASDMHCAELLNFLFLTSYDEPVKLGLQYIFHYK